MLINPNLYAGTDIIKIKAKDRNFNFHRLFYKDIGCEVGQEYTLSFNSIQTNNGSGTFTVVFYNEETNRLRSLLIPSNERESVTFTYDLDEEVRLNFYTDIAGKDANIGLTIFDFKLEKGRDRTPYIPSKSMLDTSKQAVFVAGGVFQEVYPL